MKLFSQTNLELYSMLYSLFIMAFCASLLLYEYLWQFASLPHVEIIIQTLDDDHSPPVESSSAANVEPNTSIEDHESIVTSYKELIRDQVP